MTFNANDSYNYRRIWATLPILSTITVRRPRNRWEDNIKMDLNEIERGGVDWLNLARDRDQWTSGGFHNGGELLD